MMGREVIPAHFLHNFLYKRKQMGEKSSRKLCN